MLPFGHSLASRTIPQSDHHIDSRNRGYRVTHHLFPQPFRSAAARPERTEKECSTNGMRTRVQRLSIGDGKKNCLPATV
nr:hypothetical protein CFP56_77350 [Quercus suber]